MSTGLPANNPTVVAAFQSALLHQAFVVVLILLLLAVAWNLLRSAELRRHHQAQTAAKAAAAGGAAAGAGSAGTGLSASGAAVAELPVTGRPVTGLPVTGRPGGRSSSGGLVNGAHGGAGEDDALLELEPPARRLLRIGFGLLWAFDGILQAQSSMPLGMTGQVIQPSASGSPSWVLHLVSFGTTIWNNHPVVAASATVWIQFGLGLWMLVAPRGYWSRASGVATAGWALLVWIFGEAFGGLFAPGVSILTGAPGAALFYVAAGILVALPEGVFHTDRLGAAMARVLGALFLVMGVLQAWPGRGYWQGRVPGSSQLGSLASMVHQMAQTPQPSAADSAVSSFAGFVTAHGYGVNLVAVVLFCGLGFVLLSGNRRLLRYAVPAAVIACLADWLLVQDLGFFGGTGTDPNSMMPICILMVASYLAITRAAVVVEPAVLDAGLDLPADVEPEVPAAAVVPPPLSRRPWREQVAAKPVYVLRMLAAAGAAIVVLLGAAPMAVASLSHGADSTLALAIDGPPATLDSPAPGFALTDQAAATVSLDSLRGKVVVLTFLDPVCTTDCPQIAQEMRLTDQMLGSEASSVDFVAVVANPLYRSVAVVDDFDRAERLNSLGNWYYLTGSERQLSRIWADYGVQVAVTGAGGMVAHDDSVFVIDADGTQRYYVNAAPGPGTGPSEASFAGLLEGLVTKTLARG